MKVDAVVAILAAALAVALILTAYSRYNSLQAEAYNCYGAAYRIAKDVAGKLAKGGSPDSTSIGRWEVYIYYPNGTVCRYALDAILCERAGNSKLQSRYRCYAYYIASDRTPQPVLVEVRG